MAAPDAFSHEREISVCPSKFGDFPACDQKKRSPWPSYPRIVSSICLILAFLYFSYNNVHLGRLVLRRESDQRLAVTAAKNGVVLEVFQVNAPVAVDNDECTMLLMEHSFGFSYGKPFVGNYNPPSCEFNRVVMNFTVTSRGRQFDRLALMYLNDTEVWRTSTAEPTESGIRWTYIKDMTPYLSMWKQPQKVIFDLGNLINDKYTGAFNTTLTLTFSTGLTTPPADLILPISAHRSASNSPSVFTLPEQRAITTLLLPRNAHRATVSLSACGQAAEEFWWSNVPSAATSTFTNTTGELPGFSPWREVQILIDGRLAGVQWPFPVVFTGGVVPGLWRPIVGIEAFDLREYEVDVSPWLGVLSDGAPHDFEIRVVGISGKAIAESVGSSWLVTGKVFLWLDEPGMVTKGSFISITKDGFGMGSKLATTQDSRGENVTLSTQLSVHRELDIRSTITTAARSRVVSWSQQLAYTNHNDLSAYGVAQFTNLSRTATDSLITDQYNHGPSEKYSLAVYSEYRVDPEQEGDLAINATSICEVEYRTGRGSVFDSGFESGTSGRVKTTQEGAATYVSKNGASSGTGKTNQVFVLEMIGKVEPVGVYKRDVGAAGGVVIWDRIDEDDNKEMVEGTGNPAMVQLAESVGSVRGILGRGPGSTKKVLVMGTE